MPKGNVLWLVQVSSKMAQKPRVIELARGDTKDREEFDEGND
jgi:hypothetical protein